MIWATVCTCSDIDDHLTLYGEPHPLDNDRWKFDGRELLYQLEIPAETEYVGRFVVAMGTTPYGHDVGMSYLGHHTIRPGDIFNVQVHLQMLYNPHNVVINRAVPELPAGPMGQAPW